MTRPRGHWCGGLVAGIAPAVVGVVAAVSLAAQSSQPLDVIYVPTPEPVVTRMLSMAKVGAGDIVYDLGSGDGRIVIAAVRDFHAARGVGIELDPQRIAEARRNAEAAGVADRVTFLQADLFASDLTAATVVTMYLLPQVNARLVPTLRALKPGTRIVSHNYDMGPAWKPARTVALERDVIHFWTVPRRR
jgi:predicted O-methyltransferase YrrM